MITTEIDQDTTVQKARTKYGDIVQRRQDVRTEMDTLEQAIAECDQRLVQLRAQEIISGRSGAERSETVSAQLMTQ